MNFIYSTFSVPKLNRIVFILIILFGSCKSADAQVYFDNAYMITRYSHQGAFNFDHPVHTYRPSIGVIVYQKEEGIFHFGADLTVMHRRMERELSGYNFRYVHSGLQFNPYVGITPVKDLKFELGAALTSYGTKFQINGTKEPLGEGFNGFDWGILGRTYFYFTENWAVGVGAILWQEKMLEYRAVGNFGEFEPSREVIKARNYFLFLRYQFLNDMKR